MCYLQKINKIFGLNRSTVALKIHVNLILSVCDGSKRRALKNAFVDYMYTSSVLGAIAVGLGLSVCIVYIITRLARRLLLVCMEHFSTSYQFICTRNRWKQFVFNTEHERMYFLSLANCLRILFFFFTIFWNFILKTQRLSTKIISLFKFFCTEFNE